MQTKNKNVVEIEIFCVIAADPRKVKALESCGELRLSKFERTPPKDSLNGLLCIIAFCRGLPPGLIPPSFANRRPRESWSFVILQLHVAWVRAGQTERRRKRGESAPIAPEGLVALSAPKRDSFSSSSPVLLGFNGRRQCWPNEIHVPADLKDLGMLYRPA